MRCLAFLLAATIVIACSSTDKVTCPAQIPIGDRSGCNYPETGSSKTYEYVCSYRLPCGEKTTCTCVPDSARWFCNVDCNGGLQSCELDLSTYSCATCANYSSLSECVRIGTTPYR
jgi:hypothetical protein